MVESKDRGVLDRPVKPGDDSCIRVKSRKGHPIKLSA